MLTPGGARKAYDSFATAGGHGLKNRPELPTQYAQQLGPCRPREPLVPAEK